MILVRKAAVAAIAISALLLSGCGSNFRPVATIIPQAQGNPAAQDMVAVLNQNPLDFEKDQTTVAVGSFTLIDVSGDSNSGDLMVGLNTSIPVPPVASAIPNTLYQRITFAAGNAQVATVDPDAKTVTVQSTTSGPSTITLPAGATPNSIAATTNTGLVLVSLQGDTDSIDNCSSTGAVAIIQPSTVPPSRLSPSICMPTGMSHPGFILVLPGDQKALVLDSTNSNAAFINIPNATASASAITVGTTPVWAASNASGSLVYVSNNGSNNITVLNGNTESLVATVSSGGTSPSMIVADNTLNRLYISNTGSNNVSVLSATSPFASLSTITVGTSPIALAVTPDGSKVYVANTGANFAGGSAGSQVSVINTTTFTASHPQLPANGTFAGTWFADSRAQAT